MASTDKEIDFEYVPGGFPEDLVRYKGTVLNGDPREFADRVENFEIRDDDVWVCGYMRSGTHWTKEMVWRIANDFNFDNNEPLTSRFPCFDALVLKNRLKSNVTHEELLVKMNNLPSPRFLKSHLPFHLMPRQLREGHKKPKVVYVARNPKDVCVSVHYFHKHFHNYQGSIEDTVDLFIANKLNFAPYWDNVFGYWNRRKEPNVLFLKYEDMKNDLPSVIRETAEFFGKKPTDGQVAALTEYLAFDNFQKDPKLNDMEVEKIFSERFGHKESTGFVRKGTVDQWKEEFSAYSMRRFDKWIETNVQNTDYAI